jgi:hypothetical protein
MEKRGVVTEQTPDLGNQAVRAGMSPQQKAAALDSDTTRRLSDAAKQSVRKEADTAG